MKNTPNISEKEEKRSLRDRLDGIGWALFFIMTGAMLLAPEDMLPEGSWAIGLGVIILGINLIKYMYQVKTDGFFIVIGIIALISGIGEISGLDLPVFAIILLIIGASLLLKRFTNNDWNKDWCF